MKFKVNLCGLDLEYWYLIGVSERGLMIWNKCKIDMIFYEMFKEIRVKLVIKLVWVSVDEECGLVA